MPSRILPPSGPPRVLALAQLSNSVGDGAFLVCSALYFVQVVGVSPARVGLALTLAWAVGSVAGVPLGHLADRCGPRGTSVLMALATSAAVSSFLVIRSFVPFLIAAVCYATAQSGLAAARQALLAGLVDKEARTGLLAYLQATLNGGLAIGAALGGLALQHGSHRAYLLVLGVDAVSFAICAVLLWRLPAPPAAPAPPAPAVTGRTPAGPAGAAGDGGAGGGGAAVFAVLRDAPYALVTLLNTVLLLRMPLLSLGIPLWIVERTDAPHWMVSVLFVLNTVAVMLFQVRTARGVKDLAGAARTVRASGLIMLASCAVFALTAAEVTPWAAGALLVGGAVLLAVAEMMQSAGAWYIGFELAPPHRIGQYQGFFGTGVPVARTLGPLVLTALLVTWGVPGWLLLGGLFLAAGYAMGPAARWAERTRGSVRPAPALVPAPVSGGPTATAARAPGA